jgi:hypothetical protein
MNIEKGNAFLFLIYTSHQLVLEISLRLSLCLCVYINMVFRNCLIMLALLTTHKELNVPFVLSYKF